MLWQQETRRNKGWCVPAVVRGGHRDTGDSFLSCCCELPKPRPKVSNCRLFTVGKALGEPIVWRVRLRLGKVWLAKNHVSVASMGAGSHVSFSQIRRQCLALEGGGAVDLHSPKTIPT